MDTNDRSGGMMAHGVSKISSRGTIERKLVTAEDRWGAADSFLPRHSLRHSIVVSALAVSIPLQPAWQVIFFPLIDALVSIQPISCLQGVRGAAREK
jgi:hypothetical protein